MRYAQKSQTTPNPIVEGDSQFSGLNMKLDRDKLDPGMYARGENTRCTRRVLEKRPGTITPKFANIEPLTILGAGVYSNEADVEVQLIAMPGSVMQIRSGSYPAPIPIPAGTTLAGAINFAQHGDKILLHREDGGTTLEWDGVAAAGFVAIAKSNPFDGSTILIPSPAWSVNFGNRAIFPTSGFTIGASDELDYTSVDPILHQFQINNAMADLLVGVYPYSGNNLIVGKSRSIDVLTNFFGNLDNASMEILSTEVGFAARKAAKMVGSDLYFLSANPRGVFRIQQIIQDTIQTAPVPVSDAIEPMMDRINWQYIAGALMSLHGFYLKVFVPIDGSKVNNAALVLNTVTGQWESAPDRWNSAGNMQIDEAYVTDYFGGRELYLINKGANSIHVSDIGIMDELANGIYEVSSVIETRGYSMVAGLGYLFDSRGYAELSPGDRPSAKKDFKRAEIMIATRRPSLTVTELTDSAGDERVLTPTPMTKNRSKYLQFGKPDYVRDNSNNDFDSPGREDYTPDTSAAFNLQGGVNFEKKQRSVLRFSTKARGRYISYRLENTQGECDCSGLLLESAVVQQTRRAA